MDATYALRDQDISWTPTDDDLVVVMDLRTSRYLSLNSSAATLWTMLAEGANHGSLVDGLVERYGLSASSAAADVDAFLDVLRDRELLVDPPAAP